MGDLMYCAVKAFIKKDNKALFVKQRVKDIFYWELPGGRIETGEDPYDALKREIKEELSVDCDVHEPISLYWFIRDKDGKQCVCTVFDCSISETPCIDETEDDLVDLQWLSKEEFLQENLISGESLKEMVEKLL